MFVVSANAVGMQMRSELLPNKLFASVVDNKNTLAPVTETSERSVEAIAACCVESNALVKKVPSNQLLMLLEE